MPQVCYMQRSASKESLTFSDYLQKYRNEVILFEGNNSTSAERDGAVKHLSRCRSTFPSGCPTCNPNAFRLDFQRFRDLKRNAAMRIQASVRGAIARAAFRNGKIGMPWDLPGLLHIDYESDSDGWTDVEDDQEVIYMAPSP